MTYFLYEKIGKLSNHELFCMSCLVNANTKESKIKEYSEKIIHIS